MLCVVHPVGESSFDRSEQGQLTIYESDLFYCKRRNGLFHFKKFYKNGVMQTSSLQSFSGLLKKNMTIFLELKNHFLSRNYPSCHETLQTIV